MTEFPDHLLIRASTVDERLSALFATLPGQKSDAYAAGRRLSAWCRASASGDWELFARRLARDGLTIDAVLPRLATVQWAGDASLPAWAADARWVDSAFANSASATTGVRPQAAGEPVAFEDLVAPVVEAALAHLWEELPSGAAHRLSDSAMADLCHSLLEELSELCAPALFERFEAMLAVERTGASTNQLSADIRGSETTTRNSYNLFIAKMRDGGIRQLFEAKPVLLRLLATITRQWIDASRELILRLNSDMRDIAAWLGLGSTAEPPLAVTHVADGLSDRHNDGRSVKLLSLSDGSRLLYKPKDLRIDAEWEVLIRRLNTLKPPSALRAVQVLAREGYGWTEFIDDVECSDLSEFDLFFRRAGAWLCLFHVFAGTDMHEQNMIAAGAHPVPIDLEMLLQSLPRADAGAEPETEAAVAAGQRIIESVTMTGLLPGFWRTPENTLVASGGLNNITAVYTEVYWEDINTDAMRPITRDKRSGAAKNLPRVEGKEPRVGDYVDALVAGFEAYADFLRRLKGNGDGDSLFSGFQGLRTRRVLKNTRFYYLLLERLRDHRNMTDGAEWSAELDFVARFSDWSRPVDPLWPVARSERRALAQLSVPHFTSRTTSDEIDDCWGHVTSPHGVAGVDRARRRLDEFDAAEIPWQVQIIRLSTQSLTPVELLDRGPAGRAQKRPDGTDGATFSGTETSDSSEQLFLRVAADIHRFLAQRSVRRGPGASWIGLEWFGHSGLCRPTALGDDLYSGTPGIGLFLAAQAAVGRDEDARELSLASLSAVRQNLRGANAARFARGIGIGGATGIGSIIYALVTTHRMLGEEQLLRDALRAASLVTDDVISSDGALDVFDGSAGCILGLLALVAVTGSPEVLGRAIRCGEQLLDRPRIGSIGYRSWIGPVIAERASSGLSRALNGMSHGAAGFAYTLSALAKASGREEFALAAAECVAFENDTYSESRNNWPDFRFKGTQTEPAWLCQWCHGAVGIGLARIAMLRRGLVGPEGAEGVTTDVRRALRCAQAHWPYPGDNLCCGSLGNVELLLEASRLLGAPDLKVEAARRLEERVLVARVNGEYLFDGIDRRFDLGLFRGLAGVGYACLRQASSMVPSVLTWE